MLIGEYWPQVLRVDAGIVTTPLFGVNIPAVREHIRFGTKFTRLEMDYHIVL